MGLAPPTKTNEAGFSLIEILIALGLFSLISMAGIGLVGSILQVKDRTEGRLEDLAAIQRALAVIASDFQQGRAQSVRVDERGASLERKAQDGPLVIRYEVDQGRLTRILSASGASVTEQHLLDRVEAARWRVYLTDGGWLGKWSPTADRDASAEDKISPRAISVDVLLSDTPAGVSGSVRRVVELPVAP